MYSSRDLPNPGIEPSSPALQADSLPSEPPGKPKNTGVGSLSLFQGIFPAQELNQGLLHCKWILYQLSYQRSPIRSHINKTVVLSLTPWTDRGILQARILEWVAFFFSRGSSQLRDQTQVSRIAGGFCTS